MATSIGYEKKRSRNGWKFISVKDLISLVLVELFIEYKPISGTFSMLLINKTVEIFLYNQIITYSISVFFEVPRVDIDVKSKIQPRKSPLDSLARQIIQV